MREPIYAVYPGHVISQFDKQEHFITADQLMRLYGVNPADCLVVKDSDYLDPSRRDFLARADKLIGLFPRYSGNYKLPTKR